MRYADSRCQIVSKGDHYEVTGKDLFTGQPVTVKIPSGELYAYWEGAMIQDAMPSLTADEREFLLSGIYESFPEE